MSIAPNTEHLSRITAPSGAGAPPPQPELETVMIPLAQLVASPTNPRKHFDPVKQSELEASMRACGFTLSSMLVRPLENAQPAMIGSQLFEVVAGERRLRAAHAVGVQEAPCIVMEMSDEEAQRFQLVENIQREDMNIMEESAGVSRMLDLRYADGRPWHTLETLACTMGKPVQYIEQRRKLGVLANDAKLEGLREALIARKIEIGHALMVARLPEPQSRSALAREILEPQYEDGPLPFRKAEAVMQRDFLVDISGIDSEDADLVPIKYSATGERLRGGACGDCPHRLGHGGYLFDSGGYGQKGGSDEVPSWLRQKCVQVSCFEEKKEVAWAKWQKRESGPHRRALSEQECRDLYQYGDQLDWSCKLVDLAQRPDSDDLRPGEQAPGTWAQLVRGREIEVLVARDRNGKQHELVKRVVAIEAALLNGHDCFKCKEAAGGGKIVGSEVDEVEDVERREKEAVEIELADRIDRAKLAAVSRAAEMTRVLPEGFWGHLVEELEFWAEDVLEVIADRREILVEDLRERYAAMSDQAKLGLVVEHFAGNGRWDGKRYAMRTDGWAALYGIDCKAIEKQVKAEMKAEDAAAAASAEIFNGMRWDELKHQSAEFEWTGSVCDNPDICLLGMPKGETECEASVYVARVENRWVYGCCADTGSDAVDQPCLCTGTKYDTRDLALRAGILAIKLAVELPQAVIERIDTYIAVIEGKESGK